MSKVTQLTSGELSGSKREKTPGSPEAQTVMHETLSEPWPSGELEGRPRGKELPQCTHRPAVPTASSALKPGRVGVLGWGPKPQGNLRTP